MKKTFDRALTVALLFVALLWIWSMVARTNWADARSLIDVWPGYDGALRPFIDVSVSTAVAVFGVRLIKDAWQWFAVTFFGRQPDRSRNTRVTVPAARPTAPRELTGVGSH